MAELPENFHVNPHGTHLRLNSILRGEANAAFLVLPDCNAEERCRLWQGFMLPPSGANRGCGFNVLRFMSEIDNTDAEDALPFMENGMEFENGLPFSFIVDRFNGFVRNTDQQYFEASDGYDYNIEEHKFAIDGRDNIVGFFESLNQLMPENSCILVRFNRSENHLERGLTSGHYCVITKFQGRLTTIEPHTSNPNSCNSKIYNSPPSDNFVQTWARELYVTASVLIIHYYPEDQNGGGEGKEKIKINSVVFIPKKLIDRIETALKNSMECKKESNIGGKKRKSRKNKFRKSKKNKRKSNKRKK